MRKSIISTKRMLYTIIMFPGVTAIYLFPEGIIPVRYWIISGLSVFLYFITLVGLITYLNHAGEKKEGLLENPATLKHTSAIFFAIGPLIFNLPLWLTIRIDLLNAFYLYTLGIVAVFGGLLGLYINCEARSPSITYDHLKMIYNERLQVIWPNIFFFTLTLVASPFVGTTYLELVQPKRLWVTICVGMMGFATLILIPLDNVREIREAIIKKGKKQEPLSSGSHV